MKRQTERLEMPGRGLSASDQLATPEEILDWAFRRFSPRIAASSSFQTQSLPLLHMISRACPVMKVLFVDTGYHFPETLAFRDQVVRRLDLRLEVVAAGVAGPKAAPLYTRDPDLCCFRNKVEPFLEARKSLRAWVSGIRRDQTPERRVTPVIAELPDGVVKICPLAGWSAEKVEAYLSEHDLPRHPLDRHGYPSIGCQPCTRPAAADGDPRSGRWAGTAKTECGLHREDQEVES